MVDRMDAPEEDPDTKCCSHFIIKRSNKYLTMWNSVFHLLLIVSYILVPYHIAFQKPYYPDGKLANAEVHIFEIFLDATILLNICLMFVTDNYSEAGEKISNRKMTC